MKTELYKLNNKTIARKMFNDGQEIQLYTNKVRPGNMWISPYVTSKQLIKEAGGLKSTDFDVMLNHFEYYNCNNENGYYTSFYVNVEIQ